MVLDSSACVDLILDTEPGRGLRRLVLDPQPDLLFPRPLWAEVGRVLRAKAAGRALSRLGAEAAGQPLLTTDLHLARAVREHAGAHVITHLDA